MRGQPAHRTRKRTPDHPGADAQARRRRRRRSCRHGAARVARLRGHRVTLLERGSRLGGTLFFAGLAYAENGQLLDYLAHQMQTLNVDVRLKTEATPELIQKLAADSVIVATGAERSAPAIPARTPSMSGLATNCAA